MAFVVFTGVMLLGAEVVCLQLSSIDVPNAMDGTGRIVCLKAN